MQDTAHNPEANLPAEEAGTEAMRPSVRECTSGVKLVTLGCRLNAYESEVMSQHAQLAGLDNTIIVNTCAVTSEAVRQARQALRKLRRENPNARVIVTGCAAQIDPQSFAAMAEVDHVIGNADKLLPGTFSALVKDAAGKIVVQDIQTVREIAPHLIAGFGTRSRAYVQVQNGCDHRCTFCIIPYGRGPSRSVAPGHVVEQIRRLVEGGTREVVLTGVDITSYGPDLPGTPSLGWLVRQILKHVPELARLRLSSLDQAEFDEHLLRAIAEEERLMPHLHLSLQAGDDLILKRMKRRHGRADAIRFATEVRRRRPDAVFGADLIAGFPTESEEMFRNTLDLVDDCGLTFLHVFPFSPRRGTPAARMPQVAGPLIKERAARLRRKGDEVLGAFLSDKVGQEVALLGERSGVGRTPDFAEVEVTGLAIGEIRSVRVLAYREGRLAAL